MYKSVTTGGGGLVFKKETCELEDDLICLLYQGLCFPLVSLHRELLGVQGCSGKTPRMTKGPELHINSWEAAVHANFSTDRVWRELEEFFFFNFFNVVFHSDRCSIKQFSKHWTLYFFKLLNWFWANIYTSLVLFICCCSIDFFKRKTSLCVRIFKCKLL